MANEFIYVVEDDVHIQQLLKYNLEQNGYRTSIFDNGENAMKTIGNELPDLILLDLMLPGKDGIEICRGLKMDPRTRNIPVLILTAKSNELDKVVGLEIGADDYITKPFGVSELIARIRAVMRRVSRENQNTAATAAGILKVGDITVDIDRHEVYKGQRLMDFTVKEFDLLKLLIFNKGKVLTREILFDKVWGFDHLAESRTVDVHIHYLRQKLEDSESEPRYIETVRGVGYRFKG